MSKYRNTSLLEPGETVPAEASASTLRREADRLSRRTFLARTGAAAGAVSVVGLAGCSSSSTTAPIATTTPPTVADVLNFALNLEYLEATFYLTLATGSGLSSTDAGSGAGAVTGGLTKVNFTLPGVQDLVNQLAADEQAHVEFLRATITAAGATPVSMPALNLAALGPVTNDQQFLAIARALETTGTSAYEGAIQFLISNPAGLTYAAQVHDTEGQHEGTLRQYCVANTVTSPQVDSYDIPPTPTAIFNTSSTSGLNTARTTSQVLGIVYGVSNASTTTPSAGITSGGFFPSGVNGAIIST